MNREFIAICPNCFKQGMEGNVCVVCGYDRNAVRRYELALDEFTVLRSRYMVGRVLGAGGFGITYTSYDTMANKIRAIKEYVPSGIVSRRTDRLTLEEINEDGHDIFVHGKKRFYDEAKVLYACSEIPDVVKILDYFQENNTVYLVMEYIDGITLKRHISNEGGVLPVDISLEIIRNIGNALEQVHRQIGILHRDISPDNIMITKEGRVQLIDFGSARVLDRFGNTVFLKPGYAPPEQYSSKSEQGCYTDVYALAGTLYYMLTGKMVPTAPDRLDGGSDYIRLKDCNIGISDEVSDAVDKALKLKWKERFQTVGEFINALDIKTSDNRRGGFPKKGQPYLEVVAGLMKGYRWDIPPDTVVKVGRGKEVADIELKGTVEEGYYELSRLHFKVEYKSDKNLFWIVDASANGTYVGEYELQKNVDRELPPGVIIVLGVNVCTIKLGVE